MKNKDILRIFSCVLASASLIICVFIYGEISGFKQGYDVSFSEQFPGSRIMFSGDGPNFYEYIGEGYAYIAFCFCTYIIGRLLKEKILLHTICIFALGVIIYQYELLLKFKYGVLAIEGEFSYNNWLLNSIPFDWFCLSTALTLLIIQIAILVVNSFFKSNQ
jgi:hypothetical protein